MQQVPLLDHAADSVGLKLGRFFNGHRLMLFRIELVAWLWTDFLDRKTPKGRLQLLDCEIKTFNHLGSDAVVTGICLEVHRTGEFQTVLDAKKLSREALQSKLSRVGHFRLGSLTDVVGFCPGPQMQLFELFNLRSCFFEILSSEIFQPVFFIGR